MLRWFMVLCCLSSLIFVWLVAPVALGADLDEVVFRAQKELIQRYPGARIEIDSQISLPDTVLNGKSIERLSVSSESGQGTAELALSMMGPDGKTSQPARVLIKFSAWKEVPVAIRKIKPLETLDPSIFRSEMIDLSKGMNHAYRSIILPVDTKWEDLESRQTILEGQYPLASAVQKIPIIKRGQEIQVKLLMRDLVITTTGVAEESGGIGSLIHVTAKKTKKLISGVINADGTVEVKL